MLCAEMPHWAPWVTPRALRSQPVHRWYVFPHSFTDALVLHFIDRWALSPGDVILDPFVGAGTTVVAAKGRGISATGYDLSPLAVLATRVKACEYDATELRGAWARLRAGGTRQPRGSVDEAISDALRPVFPADVLSALRGVARRIDRLRYPEHVRDFFLLALVGVLPEFSRAVANGGWLRWREAGLPSEEVWPRFQARVKWMLDDVVPEQEPSRIGTHVAVADARSLPARDGSFNAVITSPPYPNRHDYTRVFGVELLFAFLSEGGTRELRRQMLHSHPEAAPSRPPADDYAPPPWLAEAMAEVRDRAADKRIPRMLEGYFRDMHICLREMRRVCASGAHIALVVGNAQYHGVSILVDQAVVELGVMVGLEPTDLIAARYRGNSAQQMAEFGRCPSRESVVMFIRR